MNILGKLIKFKNTNKAGVIQNNQKIVPNESQGSVGSVDISGNQLPEDVSNNKNVLPQNNLNENIPNENNNNNFEQEGNKEEDNQQKNENEENLEQENNENGKENENNAIEDVDFLFLSKDKLNEFKESLISEKPVTQIS